MAFIHKQIPHARRYPVQGLDDNEGEEGGMMQHAVRWNSKLFMDADFRRGPRPNSDHQNSMVKSRYLVPIAIDTF